MVEEEKFINLGDETEKLEFKKTTAELEKGIVSIVAILNKHGAGTLFFGVNPNGDAVGQIVSESSLRDVSKAIREKIKPEIYPTVSKVSLNNHDCIRVDFEGNDCPYSAKGRYYIRTADEDCDMSPEMLGKFFLESKNKYNWETVESSIKDCCVDKNSVKSFISAAMHESRIPLGKYTVSEILKKYSLVNNGYLTNAGMYLFGNNEPITLKVAVWATDEKLTILDMRMFEGNIYSLLREAEKYIFENIRWNVEIKGSERIETPEIPITVIREALANSFVHASYGGNNTYHEICIFPGSITIYNPGKYASNYRPEEYVKENHESVIRNPLIAKILYLDRTIEQFGSGFKRISSFCKDANIHFSYEDGENGFTFIVYRANNDVGKNTTENIILTKTEFILYSLLKENPNITRQELAENISKTTRTVQRILNSLRQKGVLERVGSDKYGSWKIKVLDSNRIGVQQE